MEAIAEALDDVCVHQGGNGRIKLTRDNNDIKGSPMRSQILKEVPPTPMSMASHDDASAFVGGGGERSEDQVELLRDRKTLDLESTLTRKRQKSAENIVQKLEAFSKLSGCALQALPLQKSFHSYEEAVLSAPSTLDLIHTPTLQLAFQLTSGN